MSIIRNYNCSCRPLGSHLDSCYDRQFYLITNEFFELKKLRKKLIREKHGSTEIYKPKELYYYAITLTGKLSYDKIIDSIQKSKMFGVTYLCYGMEQNENDKEKGWYHVHLLVKCTKYIDSKEIYVKNKKDRVDVKLLRTEMALIKWHRYIHKETKFGNCPVDTSGHKIIILDKDICNDQTDQTSEILLV